MCLLLQHIYDVASSSSSLELPENRVLPRHALVFQTCCMVIVMKYVVAVLSALLPFLSGLVATHHVEKIESCSAHVPVTNTYPLKYRTMLTRRSIPCTVSVESNPKSVIRVEFHNLRKACELKPDGILIIEEGHDPIAMCENEASVFISQGPKIIIQYFSSTGVGFEMNEVRNEIDCNETLDYSYYGRTLSLSASSFNETCFVAFPGRTLVVVEDVQIEKNNCESHVDVMAGRDFLTYTYRLKQYCKKHNGLQDTETLIVCPRGLLLFTSASTTPETVRFRLEIPSDDRPLLIHSLEC
uniref:ZP domain-containing protein n=1 Tax=Steinernema glaseri TaxID=37863 RepID=A0A1I7Z7F9_9BILA